MSIKCRVSYEKLLALKLSSGKESGVLRIKHSGVVVCTGLREC